MASKLKTAVLVDDSNIVDGATIDAAKHTLPFGNAETELREGLVAVSAGDTHVKNLEDAIVGASGKTKLTKLSAGADESLEVDLDATAVTSGYLPTANGAGGWSWAAAGGGGATPVDITVTAGENLAERDYVYLNESDGKFYTVDIDASSAIKCGRVRGVVNEVGGILSAASGSVRILGEVSGYVGLTAWSPVYASATAGGITQTRPSPTSGGAQVAVIELGFAVSTTNIMVMPPKPVQYMKRDNALANDGTLTIEHHSDAMGHTREVEAFVGSLDSGASLTSYADSNQDSYASVQGGDGAGGTIDTAASGGTAIIGDSGGTDYWQAQSFIPSGGYFATFDVGLGANSGTPSGTVTWELQSDASDPSGTVLATGTFTPVASSTNTVIVPEAQRLYLDGATTYWLVLKPTTPQSTGDGWNAVYTGTSSYADGVHRYSTDSGSSWAGIGDIDVAITTVALDFGQDLAQSFQIGSGSDVEIVKLWLKKVGAPPGTLTVEIQPDSAGSPSGTAITNGTSNTVAVSTLTSSFGYVEFTFATDPTLSASTTYWLVLKASYGLSETAFVIWGTDASSPSYSSGELKSYNGTSWDAESDDAVFDVLAPGTTFVEPAVIGRWGGGTRDIAVRYDDASGPPAADSAIKTTGKNVLGVTADITLVVEVP